MPLSAEEIQNRVTFHSPTPSGIDRHAVLSKAAGYLLSVIEDTVPDGREKSLAITNVEQAKMWASAGVARNPDTV